MKTKATRADRRSCPNPKTAREIERAVLVGLARALRHIDTQVAR